MTGTRRAAGFLLFAAACRSPASTSTSTSTSDADAASLRVSSTSTDAASRSSPCAARPLPGWVPQGWRELDDWSCTCRFYVPGAKETLPAPIVWERCVGAPDAIACRTMRVDWGNDATPIALAPKLALDDAGAPVLAFQRNGEALLRLVVGIDGGVRSALLQARGEPCFVSIDDAAEGRWTLGVFEPSGDHKGVFGGTFDELHPRLLDRSTQATGKKDSWACSRWGLARMDARFDFEAARWRADGSVELARAIPVAARKDDPEGLDFSQPLMHGGAIFFTTASTTRSGINVWTEARGARPFVRFVGDPTRGAGNLGTDGKDVVWTEGAGKSESATVFPQRAIMTAPFTTEPEKLAPRRLRSDPSVAIAGQPFRVACGRAAHGGKHQPVTIVRLSDGVAWTVPENATFRIGEVIGLTCADIFVVGELAGRVNVARIALDSLGPGTPADGPASVRAR